MTPSHSDNRTLTAAEVTATLRMLEADRDRWRTYALQLRGEANYLLKLLDMLGHDVNPGTDRLAALAATMPDLPPWPTVTPTDAQAEDTVARAQAEVDGRAQLDKDYWDREGEQHVD